MMDNYVLRIYRRGRQKAEAVVGVLHDAHYFINRPFNGLDELCEMLLMEENICRRKSNQEVAECRRREV